MDWGWLCAGTRGSQSWESRQAAAEGRAPALHLRHRPSATGSPGSRSSTHLLGWEGEGQASTPFLFATLASSQEIPAAGHTPGLRPPVLLRGPH